MVGFVIDEEQLQMVNQPTDENTPTNLNSRPLHQLLLCPYTTKRQYQTGLSILSTPNTHEPGLFSSALASPSSCSTQFNVAICSICSICLCLQFSAWPITSAPLCSITSSVTHYFTCSLSTEKLIWVSLP